MRKQYNLRIYLQKQDATANVRAALLYLAHLTEINILCKAAFVGPRCTIPPLGTPNQSARWIVR
jgi:hypothetical protein